MSYVLLSWAYWSCGLWTLLMLHDRAGMARRGAVAVTILLWPLVWVGVWIAAVEDRIEKLRQK